MAQQSRRRFLRDTTIAGVGIAVTGCVSKGAREPANEKVDGESISLDPIKSVNLRSSNRFSDYAADEFDFIVVGAGAGGAPLAARLALAGFKTLLVDAGGDQTKNRKVQIPAMHPKASEDPSMSWEFFVKHFGKSPDNLKDEKYQKGARQGIFYPRAAAIGGCTAHNAMITMYNDNSDWEYIQKLAQSYEASYAKPDSWDPSNMRSFFELLERNRYKSRMLSDNIITKALLRDSRHGYDGWLATDKASYRLALYPEFANLIRKALGEGGLASGVFLNDPNNYAYVKQKSPMVALVPTATEGGVRSGPWNLIAKAQAEGDNLRILTNVLVTEVEIGADKVATGVYFVEDAGAKYEAHPSQAGADPAKTWAKIKGGKMFVKAKREVILAGGVFNTPQLLNLSGIGDDQVEALARKHGRKFVQRLDGVGRNLQDRYEIPVVNKTDKPSSFLERCTFDHELDGCFDSYAQHTRRATEPYASNGVIAGIITRSKFAHTPDPDLFIFALPLHFGGYKPKYSEEVYQPDHLTWLVLKGHPAKYNGDPKANTYRGRVALSAQEPYNPLRSPDIDFNYFPEYGKGTEVGKQSEMDLNAVHEGVQIIRRINAKLGVDESKDLLVPDAATIQDEARLKEFIRTRSWGHHASCTAPMGAKDDPYAVVDTNFRVRGVKNLRIVDASVFPRIPGLFIVTPIYMISEKAAETIITDHGGKSPRESQKKS